MKDLALTMVDQEVARDESDGIRRVVTRLCGNADGWLLQTSVEDGWIVVTHERARKRPQGWKLHVALSSCSVEDVLQRVLPLMLEEPLTFKVIASLQWLYSLNNGEAGASQQGKGITIYPADDEQAVRLAARLHRATQGLRGPAIRSDRQLCQGSLVYYRYGAFVERFAYTPSGSLQAVIETPGGELIEDRREPVYTPPSWARDPFAVPGSCEEAGGSAFALLAGRYLPIGPIYRSACSRVYEAVDLQQACRCVLKCADRDVALDQYGRDARDMLCHEAHILRRLSTLAVVPRVYDFFVEGDQAWLALEYIAGTRLDRVVHAALERGESLPLATLIPWMRTLAECCEQMHRRGIVYRDLKALNMLVTPEGELRLLDFGMAHELTTSDPQFYGGTRGYSSPQQRANELATISDDIYSFGAFVYFLVTGAEPALAPDETDLLQRSPAVMNPHLPASICQIITRSLATDPVARYTSMQEMLAALPSAAPAAVELSISSPVQRPFEEERHRYARYAQALSETLALVVQTVLDDKGPVWARPAASPASNVVLRDLGNGMAGVLWVLAACVKHFSAHHLEGTLRDGACWLWHTKRLDGPLLPGWFVGEAGVGGALLRVGALLEDRTLLAAAEEQSHLVSTSTASLPELSVGIAGQLRYHLMLWKTVGRDRHLEAAIRAGELLLAQARESSDGGLYWEIPPGYGDLSGNVYPGYGHGVAGIADVLLDLYRVTDRTAFLHAARRAATWLVARAQTTGRGSRWPKLDGGPLCAPFWCHGSGGIGHFLLHAAQEQLVPQALELARGCGWAVAEGMRYAGPSRCHGLAGSIELLADLYDVTGDQLWGETAMLFAHLLESFAAERDGMCVWLSEEPGRIAPGFLTGYAGVTETLLRLSTLGLAHTKEAL